MKSSPTWPTWVGAPYLFFDSPLPAPLDRFFVFSTMAQPRTISCKEVFARNWGASLRKFVVVLPRQGHWKTEERVEKMAQAASRVVNGIANRMGIGVSTIVPIRVIAPPQRRAQFADTVARGVWRQMPPTEKFGLQIHFAKEWGSHRVLKHLFLTLLRSSLAVYATDAATLEELLQRERPGRKVSHDRLNFDLNALRLLVVNPVKSALLTKEYRSVLPKKDPEDLTDGLSAWLAGGYGLPLPML